MSKLSVILKKEFRQFFHSPFLPKLCVVLPIMVMTVLPLVTTMEVKHVGVVMVDGDHSAFTRGLASSLNASEYLSLNAMTATYPEALRIVERGDADVIVDIPAGFQSSIIGASPMSIDISANAVNATKGMMGLQYLRQVIADEMAAIAPMQAGLMGQEGIRVSTLNMFNPTLDYRDYMIPALTIMLIVMLCGFLPALNIVQEKEKGTIEQVNVSPISHLTFILGKIIPYWIVGIVVLTMAMLIAWIVYGLVPAGNPLVIYAASALFIIVMSSIGAMIANGSHTMQQVMFVMFFFIVIFILMSGLMTPIESMPGWAQTITWFLPPRYYIDIMRAVYLRGSTFADMDMNFALLGIMAVVMALAATLTYRKTNS